MEDESHYSHNERYFPNHKIGNDIGLAEYRAATDKLQNDERAITWSTSASVIIGTAVGYISLNSSAYISELENSGVDPVHFRILLLFAILGFGFFSILHVVGLLKSLIFAERKIVVLRRMLGVSYGDSTLVLPNWRLEGASNPFALKLFPGYFSARAFPVHVILITTSLSFFILSVDVFDVIGQYVTIVAARQEEFRAIGAATWYLFGLRIFRVNLREVNEGTLLELARLLGKASGVSLVKNFEYEVYRLKLEIAELHRLKLDLSEIEKFALLIEDASFYGTSDKRVRLRRDGGVGVFSGVWRRSEGGFRRLRPAIVAVRQFPGRLVLMRSASVAPGTGWRARRA